MYTDFSTHRFIMSNPNPKTQYLTRQKPNWNHLPTKAIRLPEIFENQILEFARSLDNGLNPQSCDTSAPLWDDVLSTVKNWKLEEIVKLQLELPEIITKKKEETCVGAAPRRDRRLEQAILYLADRCDRAFSQDGAGFNAADAGFGHWLASQIQQNKPLLQAHAIAALKMVRKYVKQLLSGGLSLPEWDAIAHQYAKNSSPILIQNLDGIDTLPEHRVEIKGDMIAVYAPYDKSGKFQRDCKTIDGWKFVGEDRSWRFPLLKIEEVIEKLGIEQSGVFFISPEVEGTIALAQIHRQEEEAAKEIAALAAADGIVQLVKAANLDAPLANGWYLRDYQKKGVEWLLAHRRGGIYTGGILADHMGLGKSLEALIAAKAMQCTHDCPVFVIAPVSVMDNWVREAERAEVKIECFSWSKLPKPLDNQSYVLIADECFLYETPVLTNIGWLPIGSIVELKLSVYVASLNIERNVLEWKPVDRWISRARKTNLVGVKHSSGEFVCTANHKIWTEENGYVKAETLKHGASLRILPEYFSDTNQGQKHGEVLQSHLCRQGKIQHPRSEGKTFTYDQTAISAESLSMVRTELSNEAEQKRQSEAEILQQILCQYDESQPAAREGAIASESQICLPIKYWTETTGCQSTNERKQPNEKSCYFAQNVVVDERENFFSQRWQFKNYGTSNEVGYCITTDRLYRISDIYQFGQAFVPFSSTLLQSRYSLSREEVSNRSGWENSQTQKTEILRQEENRSFKCSRVVSVEILERGDIERLGISITKSQTVYNLEVADNHNYFADGVLVSNCHYAQNLNSQRTKKMLELAHHKNCLTAWLLTGTPIKNGRPINLYPLLFAVNHPLADDKWEYERHYCNAHQKSIGRKIVWDNTGAAHLDELAQKTEDVILRRTKQQCLTELPDKTRLLEQAELDTKLATEYQETVQLLVEDYRRRANCQKFKNNLPTLLKSQSLKAWFSWVLAYNPVSSEAEALVTINILRKVGSEFKVDSAIALAEELLEQGQQVVIFTEFVESAKAIAQRLNGLLLTGETKPEERQRLVDQFQSGENKVFVGTIKAGGVGLTLTAASNVILVDRAWTPGDCEQAEDRCHRLGQENAVFATWLQLGNIDQVIDDLLIQKQQRIEFVLKGKRKTLQGINSASDLAKELLAIL
jgi:hypothetical protein